MNNYMEFITNSITVNVLIGFLYSSIIGLVIFVLTNFFDRKKRLKSLSVDLTRHIIAFNAIQETISKISKINGPQYRKFFSDVLDNKSFNKDSLKDIPEFIIFNKILELPPINDFVIEKFDESVNNIKVRSMNEVIELLKKDAEEKTSFLRKSNAFVVIHSIVNSEIVKLNEILDFYRSLIEFILNINEADINQYPKAIENKIRVFKYCTDTMIYESQSIKKLIELYEYTLIENKRLIVNEILKIEGKLTWATRIFILTIIICITLLIIA